jgi:hypothetical protein
MKKTLEKGWNLAMLTSASRSLGQNFWQVCHWPPAIFGRSVDPVPNRGQILPTHYNWYPQILSPCGIAACYTLSIARSYDGALVLVYKKSDDPVRMKQIVI